MIIVNQHEDVIINFEKLNFIKIEADENDFDIVMNYDGDYWDVIGTYESYERAQEILRAIVNVYKKCILSVDPRTKTTTYAMAPRVYEMPKK